jgi:hypothetical protein
LIGQARKPAVQTYDSLNDDHDHKAFHMRAAEHHTNCAACFAKAHAELGGVSRGDVQGSDADYGRRAFGADDPFARGLRAIPPTGATEHLRLVPRAGGVPVEKAQVAIEMEEMFAGV